MPRALVIDDEPDICELLTLTLGRMDIDTDSATDVGGARKKLSEQRYDLCLTDMRLPDGDGLELVEWMQTHAPTVPVAVITAHGNVETAVQALKLGAFDFISKPLDLTNLRNIVENALKIAATPEDEASKLLGDSQPMRELREMVDKVARSQAPVHVSGESGTGKELVARLIHESGPRADGPFVPVNCGAIPAELMESEFRRDCATVDGDEGAFGARAAAVDKMRDEFLAGAGFARDQHGRHARTDLLGQPANRLHLATVANQACRPWRTCLVAAGMVLGFYFGEHLTERIQPDRILEFVEPGPGKPCCEIRRRAQSSLPLVSITIETLGSRLPTSSRSCATSPASISGPTNRASSRPSPSASRQFAGSATLTSGVSMNSMRPLRSFADCSR